MSKGIAIRTILLLLVGIIVVGILVYLVYSYITTGQLSVHECRARLIEICILCSNKKFTADNGHFIGGPAPSTISVCSGYAEFSGWSGKTWCHEVEDLCKALGIT